MLRGHALLLVGVEMLYQILATAVADRKIESRRLEIAIRHRSLKVTTSRPENDDHTKYSN